jgi:hypothetical protein
VFLGVFRLIGFLAGMLQEAQGMEFGLLFGDDSRFNVEVPVAGGKTRKWASTALLAR